MLSCHEARQIILSGQITQKPESVRLKDAGGLVLSAAVRSQTDLPSFCAAGIDGYALRSQDTSGALTTPVKLKITEDVLAGMTPDKKITAGICARITAGAMMPEGADAVVVQGDVQCFQDEILLNKQVYGGCYIRQQGEDVKKDEVISEKGHIVSPATLGLFASAGIETCVVYPRPKIVIIPTGTELVCPGNPISAGQVYESNTYALGAAVKELGFDYLSCNPVQDDRAKIFNFFRMALKTATHVIVSGGVSVGDHDYTRAILADCKVEEVFWQVAQLPGNRFFYGRHDQTHVFALPGNPASALVCFYEYIRPALLKSIGYPDDAILLLSRKALLSEAIKKRKGMTQFARGVVFEEDGIFRVRSLEKQGPHILSTFAKANCLIVLPDDVDAMPAGAVVEVHLLK
ncbi:MAG: molybdopterin molybdotransferase MoeA [Deltaproteobacteria bacterium]|nr:molybdopterin molybdotransferase MoeA [Deltaproteobacteria bacterium]